MSEPAITRCPTAACAPTTGTISAADQAELERHYNARKARRNSVEMRRRAMYSHWPNFKTWVARDAD